MTESRRFPTHFPRFQGRTWEDASRELDDFSKRISQGVASLNITIYGSTFGGGGLADSIVPIAVVRSLISLRAGG
jgi:hypothetical protein